MAPFYRRGLLLLVAGIVGTASAVMGQNGFETTSILAPNMAADDYEDSQAEVARASNGTTIAVWSTQEYPAQGETTDQDIAYSKSTNGGIAWTNSSLLVSSATSDTQNDTKPHIATDGQGTWIVVWHAAEPGGDTDIYYSVSTDDGDTWSDASILHQYGLLDSGNDFAPRIATNKSGKWIVAWHTYDTLSGTKGSDSDVLYVESSDDGENWTEPELLDPLATTDGRNDFLNDNQVDSNGNWLIIYGSANYGGQDNDDLELVFRRSTDAGNTWSQVQILNLNYGTDNGADEFAKAAYDENGNWMTIWESTDSSGGIGTDHDIYAAFSSNGGQTWSAVQRVNSVFDGTASDRNATIATDGDGFWLAAWDSTNSIGGSGFDKDVITAYSLDQGQTWNGREATNSDANSDGDDDYFPRLIGRESGLWLLLWTKEGQLTGDPSAEDGDILYSLSDIFAGPPTVPVIRPILSVEVPEPATDPLGLTVYYNYSWTSSSNEGPIEIGPTTSRSSTLREGDGGATFNVGEEWVVRVTAENSEGRESVAAVGIFEIGENASVTFRGWVIY